MAYDNVVNGTVRIDRQAYLTSTSSAIRVFDIFFISSLSNAAITINDIVPTTTATSTSTEKLRIIASTSGTTYWTGSYSSSVGVLFTDGALFHTSPAFGYAVVNYHTERK